jgi:hypothetical protein
MSKLSYSTRLFAGAIVYFAEESAGISDASTKPAYNHASWKEIGAVQSLKHTAETQEEKYSAPDADRGWINLKDVFTLADIFELKTREVSELVHRLGYGTSAALVQGTAQTPFIAADRKVCGWIKIQQRKAGGTDHARLDIWCEVRLKDDPATEKKTQEPTLELYVLSSTLNAVLLPS